MGKTFSGEEFPLHDHGVTAELTSAAAVSVGEIALSWCFIESHFRSIYWTLERVGGVGIGVPMGTSDAKLEVILDIVRQAGQKLDVLRPEELGAALVDAVSHAKTIADVRNVVCHWTIVQGSQKPTPRLRFAQWRGQDWRSVWKDKWYTIPELELYAQRSKGLASVMATMALEAINRLEPR
jgi:hypothetical protein